MSFNFKLLVVFVIVLFIATHISKNEYETTIELVILLDPFFYHYVHEVLKYLHILGFHFVFIILLFPVKADSEKNFSSNKEKVFFHFTCS